MGDPVQLVLRGYELTLRLAEAAKIEIVETTKEKVTPRTIRDISQLHILEWASLGKRRITGRIGSEM